MRRRSFRVVLTGWVVVGLLAEGCAMKFKKEEKAIEQQPINCATAEGDVRVLESEKAHVAQQVALGVTAIYPAGLVIGILTGTEGTKLKVATGEYNRKLEQKIEQIKTTCGLQ